MDKKSALILGGGVAGCAVAHFLKSFDIETTIVNKHAKLGGLARTETYAGHPYEFGPHVWFWPGGIEDPINKTIHELSEGELFYINRRLFSYIESDKNYYRYPLHYDDIQSMPDSKQIYEEISANRDLDLKLIAEKMPVIGKAKFAEYFQAAIGKSLYSKFMKSYTHKMWNIDGDDLETSMVWADRFNHAYSDESKVNKWMYDPMKFTDHTLGKGIEFQVYPKKGWNVVWDKMASDSTKIISEIIGISSKQGSCEITLDNGTTLFSEDFTYVVNTLDLDRFFGEKDLPYTGRMMFPLLIPDLNFAFPKSAESIHYSGTEFMTRVTEMKQITQHESEDTLLLIEVPVLPGGAKHFPSNVIQNAKEKNLFEEKAYPQQSKNAIAYHNDLSKKSHEIRNWNNVGRHAQFKYWGMPETVKSAYDFVQSLQ